MEKENKYYNIIENLVRGHKKFPGLEPIIDDIIEDVYSHSEVIISTVSNDTVINAYLSKVVSTSIITVPKRMNFQNEAKTRIIEPPIKEVIQEEKIKVDTSLVDKMINLPETQVIQEEQTEEVIDKPVVIEQIIEEPVITEEPVIIEETLQEIIEEPVLAEETDELIEEINLDSFDIEPEAEEKPLLFEDAIQEEVLFESTITDEPANNDAIGNNSENNVLEANDTIDLGTNESVVEDELDDLILEDIQETLIEEPSVEEPENIELEEDVLIIEDTSVTTEDDIEEELVLDFETQEDDLTTYVKEDTVEEVLEISDNEEIIENIEETDEISFDTEEKEDDALTDFSNIEETESLELVLDDSTSLDLIDNEDIETETIKEVTVNFVSTDYSKFEFSPENVEAYDTIDTDLIAKELTELNNKKPELSILEIYNLKYKDNMPVSEISSKLDISENRVIEALNEIIAVI